MMDRTRSGLVSVVVATNRNGRFLAAALDSVVDQSYAEWEIVVVDDGSADPAALDRTVGRYPRARIIHQANAGSSVARNVGVSVTDGEYLAFLDDDDLWVPQRLERHVAAFTNQPDAVLSYSKMHSIDEAGNVINPADQTAVTGRSDILRRKVGILLPNLMIRRSSLQRIGGFHPAFRRAQDLDLVLRAANDGPFAFVDEDLVAYRAHSDNVTRQWKELVRSIDHIVALHRWAASERGDTEAVIDHQVSHEANQRFAAWSGLRSTKQRLRKGDYSNAVKEIAAIARIAPDAPLAWLRARTRRH